MTSLSRHGRIVWVGRFDAVLAQIRAMARRESARDKVKAAIEASHARQLALLDDMIATVKAMEARLATGIEVAA